MEDVIATYVAELLKKANLNALPDEFAKDYVNKLSAEVQQRLGIMALSEMDEVSLKQFEEIMNKEETPDQKMLLEFFKNHIPDFENKVQKTLSDFSKEFLQEAEKFKSVKV